MKGLQYILSGVLLAVLCFLPLQVGECFTKDVATSFGSIKLPENAYVTEYDFKNDLDAMEPKMRRDMEKIAHLLNMYIITVNDGESYRTSLAVAFFFDNELQRAGKNNLTEEQKQRYSFRFGQWQQEDVQKAQDNIRNALDKLRYDSKDIGKRFKKIHKISFDTLDKGNLWQNNPTGLVDYEWDGLNALKINNEYGYATKGRFAAYFLGILTSMYFEAYAYNLPEKGVGSIMFICSDSERDYWAPIFSTAVSQSSL